MDKNISKSKGGNAIENRDKITRKEAIQKLGKYAALTAIGTFIILNPQKSQASSVPDSPGDGFFD